MENIVHMIVELRVNVLILWHVLVLQVLQHLQIVHLLAMTMWYVAFLLLVLLVQLHQILADQLQELQLVKLIVMHKQLVAIFMVQVVMHKLQAALLMNRQILQVQLQKSHLVNILRIQADNIVHGQLLLIQNVLMLQPIVLLSQEMPALVQPILIRREWNVYINLDQNVANLLYNHRQTVINTIQASPIIIYLKLAMIKLLIVQLLLLLELIILQNWHIVIHLQCHPNNVHIFMEQHYA